MLQKSLEKKADDVFFKANIIKGRGRAKTLGYPTINLDVCLGCSFKKGVYAVSVTKKNEVRKGVMHYGSSPTFSDKNTSCEVHIFDWKEKDDKVFEKGFVNISILKKIRSVIRFKNRESLISRIKKDIDISRQVKSLV